VPGIISAVGAGSSATTRCPFSRARSVLKLCHEVRFAFAVQPKLVEGDHWPKAQFVIHDTMYRQELSKNLH